MDTGALSHEYLFWDPFPSALIELGSPHQAVFQAWLGPKSDQGQTTSKPSGHFQKKPAVPSILLGAIKHAQLSRMLQSFSLIILVSFHLFFLENHILFLIRKVLHVHCKK